MAKDQLEQEVETTEDFSEASKIFNLGTPPTQQVEEEEEPENEEESSEEEEEESQENEDSSENENEELEESSENENDDNSEESEEDEGNEEGNTRAIDNIALNLGIDDSSEYEDTSEGLNNMISDVVQEGVKQGVVNLFSQVPVMKDFYDHVVVAGRSVDSFMKENKTPDFNSFKLDDEKGQEDIIRYALSQRNLPKQVIDSSIEAIKNEGALEENAKLFHTQLSDSHKEIIENNKKEEEKRIAEEREYIEKTKKEWNTLIDTGKINGVNIPTSKRDKFRNFVFGKNAEGNSILQEKLNNLDINKQALLYYILSEDFNVDLKKSSTLKEESLTNIIKNNKERSGKKKVQPKKKVVTTPKKATKIDFTNLTFKDTKN